VLSPQERVDLVLASPTAAAMFVCAHAEGLTAENLADPATAMEVASTAMNKLNPWSGQAVYERAAALDKVNGLRDLVAAVVGDTRNTWWWLDLQRERQLWVSDITLDPAAFVLPVPTKYTRWMIYAQHPNYADCIDTSTELDVAPAQVRSGLHNELAGAVVTDWNPSYPLRQASITVSDTARVYEIHQPQAWRELALRYADLDEYAGPDANLLSSAGIDHGPAPLWHRVAADWDGVHLSFFGLLTTLYTPLTHDGIATTLWAWLSERTLWLRNAFETITELEPLTEAPYAAPSR
jgi:hypothetical protein